MMECVTALASKRPAQVLLSSRVEAAVSDIHFRWGQQGKIICEARRCARKVARSGRQGLPNRISASSENN